MFGRFSVAICVLIGFAFALTVGCKKSPGYVGTFEMELAGGGTPPTDSSKEALFAFIINADGTYISKDLGKEKKGTYQVQGNRITFLGEGQDPKESLTMIYDDKTETLSTSEGAFKMVLKKKK